MASGKDTISRSLMKFKRGGHPDLDAWIDCAREALAGQPPAGDTILVRALGHRETTARNTRITPLDLLCQALAATFGCRYLPTLLTKCRETVANKELSRPEREAALLGVYSAHLFHLSAISLPGAPLPPILVVDDIFTTGATVRSIISALRQASTDCPIRVFTLARGTQDPLSREFTPLCGRNFHLRDSSGWTLANSV